MGIPLSSLAMMGVRIFLYLFLYFCYVHGNEAPNDEIELEEEGERRERGEKGLSVFNVVKFPNSACDSTDGFNGTCFTASECTSLGGSASGSCASSFGVCCVFSLGCGSTTSSNISYATIDTFSTTANTSPCTYTYCKVSSDVCKLRIDFEKMEITGPAPGLIPTLAAAGTGAEYLDGPIIGDCRTDTLTITNPGGASPPIICGYNTGQHMYVPASDQCNMISLGIDTATTGTTRSWQIKVTQYECGNMRAPEQDCLQYHTATSGKIASFNWDTTNTGVTLTEMVKQIHLTSQYYDICIRRSRGYCSVCFSPELIGTANGETSSYGISASNPGSTIEAKNAVGSMCTGKTIAIASAAGAAATGTGFGDYLAIMALQPGVGTATATSLQVDRICGTTWNAIATTTIALATACSWATPFRVGVHFDADDVLGVAHPAAAPTTFPFIESTLPLAAHTGKSGIGTTGFYLAYWQNTC